MFLPLGRADHRNFRFGERHTVKEKDKRVAIGGGWDELQIELPRSLPSSCLGVIDCPRLSAPFSVFAGGHAVFHLTKIALSLDADFKIVFVPFDWQWIRARAEKNSRRFDAVEHAAGFFSDVINPFAEIGVGGALTVVFEPDVVSLGGIDQG